MDADALHRLNEVFNGPSTNTPPAVWQKLAQNSQETVFVAEKDGAVAAFLCGQILRSFCYTAPTVEFTELYVQDAHRRQGAASALMAYAETWYAARGVTEFRLLTGRDNKPARAFYKQMGYRFEDEVCYAKRGGKERVSAPDVREMPDNAEDRAEGDASIIQDA